MVLFAYIAQVVDNTTCGDRFGVFVVLLILVDDIIFFTIFDLAYFFLILMILTLEIRTFAFLLLEIIFNLGLHSKERLLPSNEHFVFLLCHYILTGN